MAENIVGKARVFSGGRITVPTEVRSRLGIGAGDKIEFIEDETGCRVEKVSPSQT
jgi:AbrB family looped-hinge helix DNA binding protein